jgi:hypothetical protein
MCALGVRYFAPVPLGRLSGRTGNGATAARKLFERQGATFVKFGQFVASAPGIVGESLAEEFRTCLDAGPEVPFRQVRLAVERLKRSSAALWKTRSQRLRRNRSPQPPLRLSTPPRCRRARPLL